MMTIWMMWRPVATATTWKKVTTKKKKRKKPVSPAAAAWVAEVLFRAVKLRLEPSEALPAQAHRVNQRAKSLLPKSARLRAKAASVKQKRRLPVLPARKRPGVLSAVAAGRRVQSAAVPAARRRVDGASASPPF